MKDDNKKLEASPHYSGPPFTLADLVEAQRQKAEPLAEPLVCFDGDLIDLRDRCEKAGKDLSMIRSWIGNAMAGHPHKDQLVNMILGVEKNLGGDR